MTKTKAKILFAAPLAIVGLFALGRAADNPLPTLSAADRLPGKDSTAAYEPLVPAGETVNEGGLSDPSIAYTPDGKTGWLAYTAIRRGTKYVKQAPIGPYCETHLAKTINGGKTWTFMQAINHSVDDTLLNYDGQKLPGVWRYEAASLVHTPGDAGREWKVFVHFYFWNPQMNRMPAYGCISMQTASDPAGKWTEPEPLFGSERFPPKPYNFTSINVNALDPSLKDTLVYSEPGAFHRDGTLYVSLTALVKSGPEKIVLLASDDHYHAQTWRFINILVTNEDARQLGYKRFDGSAIAEQAGRVFFLVSPDSGISEHVGSMIIEFADLGTGKLKRDASGKLIIHQYLHEPPDKPPRLEVGHGCFDEHNTYGGLILPQMVMKDARQVLQLWSTHQSLIGDEP